MKYGFGDWLLDRRDHLPHFINWQLAIGIGIVAVVTCIILQAPLTIPAFCFGYIYWLWFQYGKDKSQKQSEQEQKDSNQTLV